MEKYKTLNQLRGKDFTDEPQIGIHKGKAFSYALFNSQYKAMKNGETIALAVCITDFKDHVKAYLEKEVTQ